MTQQVATTLANLQQFKLLAPSDTLLLIPNPEVSYS
jgi:hypothetical protein